MNNKMEQFIIMQNNNKESWRILSELFCFFEASLFGNIIFNSCFVSFEKRIVHICELI